MKPVGTRKVLVTGGGTGIGRAVAALLLSQGGSVVVCGRRPGPLAEVASLSPGRAFALPCDLSLEAGREGLLERAAALMGGLDGLVHSAGEVVHQGLGAISEKALRSQLELNLVAPLRLAEQALRQLEDGGGVVFVGSTLSARPIASSAVYSAAKAGLMQVMKVLALSGAPRRIRANAVLPGVVDTQMVRAVRPEPGQGPLSDEETARRVAAQLEALRKLHPLGRLGSVDEVASAVVHLLGAPWTTGSELVLDGGLLLRE